ncbi:UNVERIFIED_CONTAM: hypothetical protein Sangu_2037900 [Sesamum angustifolium]|uniref:Uncharacterized protein n=1 Tax=Sesamum angustifolium TaxID=2727405 RepID=A0AAW2LJG6_9LAMI
MKIKFFMRERICEAKGDQLQSHKCYVEVVRNGQKRDSKDLSVEEFPNIKGMTLHPERSKFGVRRSY